jgi:superfamily II DNA/RNA helicase
VELLQKPAHMLVATPGRLLDLLDDGHLTLSHTCYVVLDEADKMLSLGFQPQLERLKQQLLPAQQQQEGQLRQPKKKKKLADGSAAAATAGQGQRSRPQVALFTATMPDTVQEAAAQWLAPSAARVRVAAGADSISRTVAQVVQVCAEHKKPAKLLKHLAQVGGRGGGGGGQARGLVVVWGGGAGGLWRALVQPTPAGAAYV